MIVICALIIIGFILFVPLLYLFYLKFFSPPSPTTTPTTMKGREGFVTKEIQPENIKGKVKINESSKVWSATANERIEEGTKVRINEVEGVHLIVEAVEEDEGSKEESFFGNITDSLKSRWPSSISPSKNKIKKKSKSSEEEVPLEEEISDLEEEEVSEELEAPEDQVEDSNHFSTIAASIRDGLSSTVSFFQNKFQREEKILEDQKLPEETEEEIEDKENCPSCDALIPVDSEECPECGAEVESVEEEKEEAIEEKEEDLEEEIFELVDEESEEK